MVAYHYPPEGGSSGVLRTLKFSKYLPSHGWIPHVLTLNESLYPVKDKGLLADIPPEAVIHRTFAVDSTRHLAVKGRYLALSAIPDRLIGWLPFGVARGLRVIHKEDIQVLYSTCPSPTAHLIAATLKIITGLPWVADFRDPWVEEGFFPVPGSLRYRVESSLEGLVVRRCDRMVVTTPRLRREFLSRYPELEPDKVQVIYNGYDEPDFQNLNEEAQNGCFEIVHAGLVTREFRDPFPLLEVLADMFAEGDLPPDKVRLTFLGGGSWVSSKEFSTRLTQLALDGVVEIARRVSHQEALQRQAKAAALLLLQASDDTKTLIPAKAFEYLRIGRPIIALTLEGATADILKGMDQCYVYDPTDRTGLRRALLALFDLWQRSPEKLSVVRPIQQYERGKITAELAQVLEQMVD